MDKVKSGKKSKHENEQKQEELFFENGHYYTREEFFNPDEDHDSDPKKNFKWMKKTIVVMLTISLLSYILAIWPKLYNSATIEFLKISRELSKNEDVQLYKESVVVVKAGNSKGTGFYFSDEGYIMTNYHVIDNEPKITVTFQDGKSYRAEVIDSDDEIDIAVIKIDAKRLVHPVLEFEEDWEPDQPIYIIGNPLFFNFIANKGNVLGLTPAREIPMLMIDAPIYKGNSGSPVINYDGKVVGIIYATARVDHDGSQIKVGLAIPVDYLKEYVEFEEK